MCSHIVTNAVAIEIEYGNCVIMIYPPLQYHIHTYYIYH